MLKEGVLGKGIVAASAESYLTSTASSKLKKFSTGKGKEEERYADPR